MSIRKATRLGIVVAATAIVAAPASASAFNPQPDPPGFGAKVRAAYAGVHSMSPASHVAAVARRAS